MTSNIIPRPPGARRHVVTHLVDDLDEPTTYEDGILRSEWEAGAGFCPVF